MAEKSTNLNEGGLAMETLINRRNFLLGAGVFAAGLAVGARNDLFAQYTAGLEKVVNAPAVAGKKLTPILPYVKLDPDAVRRAAYQQYFIGWCGYGAAKGILMELAKALGPGAPHQDLLENGAEFFRFGGGGGGGTGNTCGTLMGAAGVMGLLCPNTIDWDRMTADLYQWYGNQPFPSGKLDDISKFKNQPQSKSGSPMCHLSVSKWSKVAGGVRMNAPERQERCGKMAGDVAARAVEMLNTYYDGKYVPTYRVEEANTSCVSCHLGPQSKMFNTYDKGDCSLCHPTGHKKK
jgi:hypothetical protein